MRIYDRTTIEDLEAKLKESQLSYGKFTVGSPEWEVLSERNITLLKENIGLKDRLEGVSESLYLENKTVQELQAQLKKLQPFERGAEGWVRNHHSDDKFAKTKAEYIAYWGKKHIVWMHFEHGKIRLVDDFTTENPHKKETVFRGDHDTAINSVENAKLVVKHKLNRINTYNTDGDMCLWAFTQIGDDHQAKFDDPNNDKYINLTK